MPGTSLDLPAGAQRLSASTNETPACNCGQGFLIGLNAFGINNETPVQLTAMELNRVVLNAFRHQRMKHFLW